MPEYRYRGAGALVDLHDQHLREFVVVWQRARRQDLALPVTKDPDYASLDHLLWHVLACARGYLVWCCEQLDLPAPTIDPAPEVSAIADQAETYLDHVLAGWRHPLAEVSEERFGIVYPSRWQVGYCVDAMLEHAVMHPIRHTHQLRSLLGDQP